MAVFVAGHGVPFSFWRILTVKCNCNDGGTSKMQSHWRRHIFSHSQSDTHTIAWIRNKLLSSWSKTHYPIFHLTISYDEWQWEKIYAWWIYYCIRFYKSHQDPTNNQWHLICKRWGLSLLRGTVTLFPFDRFLQWIAIAMMEAQVKCNCIDEGTFSHIPNEISIYTTLLSELKVRFLLHGWLQMGQVDIITKVWYEKCFSSKSDTCMDINWFPIMNPFLVLQLSYKNMLQF